MAGADGTYSSARFCRVTANFWGRILSRRAVRYRERQRSIVKACNKKYRETTAQVQPKAGRKAKTDDKKAGKSGKKDKKQKEESADEQGEV